MINQSDFENKINLLLKGKSINKIAVAVSGGADSLCLTFLLHEWVKKQNISLYAFTVDHDLRSESASEAAYVHDLLTEKGICHETLFWSGEKPKVAIEEKARQARYDLLLNACKEKQIEHLCLAHHQNDQAETFLMRLIRSSGVDGLSAMQRVVKRENVFLLRPLLDYPRSRIQKTLQQHFHIRWIEDPSNTQDIYERVRLRHFQTQLDNLGLTASSITLSAKRLSRARNALEWMTDTFMTQHAQINPAGFVFIPNKPFNELPSEIQLRVLDKSMAHVIGSNYQSRMIQLEKMLEKMPCRLTLHDCQIVSRKDGFYVCAEYAKMPAPKHIQAGQKITWGRFIAQCSQSVKIAPLGDNLKIKNLPALVRKAIPAFFDEKGLAFVPSIDYKRENTNINGTIELKDKKNG